MNMMTMAKLEEGIAQAFENWPFPISRPTARQVFEDGFRAGVAWAMRQAKTEGSSPAVGIKFLCIFCGKEFNTVEACNVCEESH